MKKAATVHLTTYDRTLRSAALPFREDANTLTVGNMIPLWDHALFISCRTIGTEELLKAVLPILKKLESPFRIIKSQLLQYRLNAGAFGEQEVGKVISIFPKSQNDAAQIIACVNSSTLHLKGPVISGALRVGNLIYIQSIRKIQDRIQLAMPEIRSLPLAVPQEYRPKKRSRFFSWRYLHVQTIRSTPKGIIFKGINLNRLSFSWCFIKEGRPNALDDHFDRDMKDRLHWQKEVLADLCPYISTPKVIDLFERKDASYLVLEYVEGTPFGRAVVDILDKRPWKGLDGSSRRSLLGIYLKAIRLVADIHKQGFIHRDITEGNFIIMPDGQLCILDFELAFNQRTGQPTPPFLLGTPGYASPEQLQYFLPEYSDDIYSVGALLGFVISGTHPRDLIAEKVKLTRSRLLELSNDQHLTALIMNCLNAVPQRRPTIDSVIKTIEILINETPANDE